MEQAWSWDGRVDGSWKLGIAEGWNECGWSGPWKGPLDGLWNKGCGDGWVKGGPPDVPGWPSWKGASEGSSARDEAAAKQDFGPPRPGEWACPHCRDLQFS